MKNHLKEYKENIDKVIKEKDVKNIDNVIEKHLVKIEFFQHERLIHLIVTMFTGLFCIITFLVAICSGHVELLIPFVVLLVLFVPYILHYFFLENNVQELYYQYDKLLNKKKTLK